MCSAGAATGMQPHIRADAWHSTRLRAMRSCICWWSLPGVAVPGGNSKTQGLPPRTHIKALASNLTDRLASYAGI